MEIKEIKERHNDLTRMRWIDKVKKENNLFFVMYFVDNYCRDILDNFKYKGTGRPPYPARLMLRTLLYTYMDKITSPTKIAKYIEYNICYMFLMDGLTPPVRTISRYRQKFSCYYKVILSKTLQMANDFGITTFDYIDIDGTIIKAYNSPYNVIHKDDVERLIDIIENNNHSKEIIKKLRKPALDLLKKRDLETDMKLDFLYHVLEELETSKQETCPLYDTEARWMLNKKHYKEISINVQTAVDYASNLILAVHVSNHPTDDYLLPEILSKAMTNSPEKIKTVIADCKYNNENSAMFLEENQIDAYIPTVTQTKKKRKKDNPNPFHKDHMVEIEGADMFVCFNNELLYLQNTHKKIEWNEKYQCNKIKITKTYYNKEACANCPYTKLCFSKSQKYRTVTDTGSEYLEKMKFKLETPDANKILKMRNTVEGPNGTLKNQYHINNLPFIGIENKENLLNLYCTVYNLNRIFKIIESDFEENTEIQEYIQQQVKYFSTLIYS